MDIQELKQHILENDLVGNILENLGCHSIRSHGGYISCGNHDGNNTQAIVIYLNENLTCINYTRTITKNNKTADILDLISFVKDCTFFEALKWTCDTLGLDYYRPVQELPESLQILKMLEDMKIGDNEEENTQLKPISEKVLEYYLPYGNVLFEDDGISLETQREFEVGYDPQTNSITIPIRDELGSLIAIKARRFKYTPNIPKERRKFSDELLPDETKYFYIMPGAKSQVLYGLHKNIKMIQNQGVVFVVESEKAVQQLYEIGYYSVSTSGSRVSKRQVEMLTRLGVKIVICFDKDIDENDLQDIADKFMDGVPIYAIIDKKNILDEKESPSDNIDKWYNLIANHIYKIK